MGSGGGCWRPRRLLDARRQLQEALGLSSLLLLLCAILGLLLLLIVSPSSAQHVDA